MKLILTRHGSTVDNELGVAQGHTPGKLSKTGIEQAQKLALRLKSEALNAIYSSDLARAADTARIIAQYHSLPLIFVKELRERNLGSLTGKKKSEIDWLHLPPDVETADDMRARAKRLLTRVYKKYHSGTVVFVGHSGINAAMITAIMNKPAESMYEFQPQKNAAVNIFEISEENKVHLINCIQHL